MHPSSFPRRARTLSLLVMCLVVLGALSVPPTLAATKPATAAAQNEIRIGLDPTAVPIVTGDDGVDVVGSISNDSDTAIDDGTVHVALSGALLDTPGAVSIWEAGRSQAKPETVASVSVGAIAPGAVRQFRVKIAAARIPWKYQLAALPMTLRLTEGRTVTSASTRSFTRTTLQMQRGAVDSPLNIGWVIPLTLPADPALFGPSGPDRDQAWARAIGPGSRIDQLITGLADQPVTWLIDPILLDPPAAADDNVPAGTIDDPATSTDTSVGSDQARRDDASPTPSATASSTPSAGPSTTPSATSSPTSSPAASADPSPSTSASGTASSGEPDPSESTPTSDPTDPPPADPIPSNTVETLTAELLTKLRGLPSDQTIWWSGYDDPDVLTLLQRDPALLQRDLRRPLPPALRALSTQRAVWPQGEVGAGDVRRIAGAWTSAGQATPIVVLPRRAAADPSAPVTGSVRKVAGTGGVVLYHEDLSATVSAAGGDPGLRAAKFLASSIAIYQQAPGSDRSLTVAVPRQGTTSPAAIKATIGAIRSSAWIFDLAGGAMNGTDPKARPTALLPAPARGPAYPPVAASALSPELIDRLGRQRRRVNTLGTILVDSGDVVDARHRALDVIGSTRWRGHPGALQIVSRTQSDSLRAISGKVSVNPSTVNFFADSGRLAITIVNDLNRDVHDVVLRLQPRKYLLRIGSQPAPLDLPANSRIAVRSEVEAISPGRVQVDAQLTNADGAPIGNANEVTQLEINVRPTSTWIYWVLGIVGGLVLIFGLWRSLRQGPRRTTLDPTSTKATPPDAIVATAPSRIGQLDPDDESPTTKASPPDER